MKRLFSLLCVAGLVGSALLFGSPSAFAMNVANDEPAKTEPVKKDAPKAPAEGETKKDADKSPADAKETEPKKEETVPAEAKLYYVKIATSKGDIVVELNNERAPISTKNFLSYVDKKHYEGTIFHRVIPGFMIQGGGMSADMKERGTDKPIKNESSNGLSNARGSIAMARTSALDSATSQFFINVVDNRPLDAGQYAVFGKVVAGMDVVDQIVAVPTTNKLPHQNVPKDPITINTVTRLTDAEAAALTKKAEEPAKK